MKDTHHDDLGEVSLPSAAKVMDMMGVLVRALCTVVGVVVLCVGLYLSCRVFYTVYDASTHPEEYKTLAAQWGEVAGGPESLKFQLAPGEVFEFSRMAGVVILAGAALLLGVLSSTMMITGARIIYWTTSAPPPTRP